MNAPTTTGTDVAKIPMRQVADVAQLLGNEGFRRNLAAVASRTLTPERMLKIVARSISANGLLAKCEPMSMYRAVMSCGELNLEPNSPMGHAFLIPFFNGREKRYEVQFILGYKGMLALALRHPNVLSIHADVVFSDDLEWSFRYGSGGGLTHIPGPREGAVVGAYCYASLRDGGEVYRFMTTAEIIKIRDRSQGWKDAVKKGKTEFSPWSTHELAMFRKTAVRGLGNGGELPMSPEFADAITLDQDQYSRLDLGDAIDGTLDGATEHDEDGVVVDKQKEPEQGGGGGDKDKGPAPVTDKPAAKQPATAAAADLAAAKAKVKARAQEAIKAGAEAAKAADVVDPDAETSEPDRWVKLAADMRNSMIDLSPERASEVLEILTEEEVTDFKAEAPDLYAELMEEIVARENTKFSG